MVEEIGYSNTQFISQLCEGASTGRICKCSICLPDCCESVVEIFGEDYGYSFQLDQITEESEENVIYGSIF